VDEVGLKDFTLADVSRFAIASVMGQPSKTIKVAEQPRYYLVSYTRKSDSQKFEYKIKFEDQNIIWAPLDGRWRDSHLDEKITYSESNKKIKIKQTFSDGSSGFKEYLKGD
jgi:hypothetical protein